MADLSVFEGEDDAPTAPAEGVARDDAPSPVTETRGPWLDVPVSAVYGLLHREVERQDAAQRVRRIRAKANRLRRSGVPGVRVIEKVQDVAAVRLYVPPGATSAVRVPNKADDLCKKLIAQLFVDPARPDVEPLPGDQGDESAAEFAAEWLDATGGESGTQDAQRAREAVDAAMTDGTGWLWLYTHPYGEWRPEPIMASPDATSPDDPEAVGVPNARPPIVRYLTAEGAITDDPGAARRQWVPRLCLTVVVDGAVTLLPSMARDVADADGAIVTVPMSLGRLRALVPDVAAASPEQLAKIVGWSPKAAGDILPAALAETPTDRARGESLPIEQYDPDTRVWCYVGYRRSTPDYPDGAYVICNPGFAQRGPWVVTVERPEGGSDVRPRDIPLAQFTLEPDPVRGDPRGRALMEAFAPADDTRQAVWGSIIEHLDMLLHPNVFLASTSPIQPGALGRRDGTPIRLNPGDAPIFEQIPTLPGAALGIVDKLQAEINTAAGLNETAQGLEASSVTSGIQAQTVREQALTAISGIFQRVNDGLQRVWRVKLQAAQTDFTVPQRIVTVGDDQTASERWFRGADFAGIRDVVIRRGSGTLFGTFAKQQYVSGLQQLGWITPQEAARVAQSGTQGFAGWKSHPERLRVLRELARWWDGPPEGWTPAQPAPVDPATGQPMVDPRTGQPLPGTPASSSPFAALPQDGQADIAGLRMRELADAMASSRFLAQDAGWQQLVKDEYSRAADAVRAATAPSPAPAAPAEAPEPPEPPEDPQAEAMQGQQTAMLTGQAMAQALTPLANAMAQMGASVEALVQQLPALMAPAPVPPAAPQSINVTSTPMPDLTDMVGQLAQTTSAIQTAARAVLDYTPQVNVAPASVTVQPTPVVIPSPARKKRVRLSKAPNGDVTADIETMS